MQRPKFSFGSLPSTANCSNLFSTASHPPLPPEVLSRNWSPLIPVCARDVIRAIFDWGFGLPAPPGLLREEPIRKEFPNPTLALECRERKLPVRRDALSGSGSVAGSVWSMTTLSSSWALWSLSGVSMDWRTVPTVAGENFGGGGGGCGIGGIASVLFLRRSRRCVRHRVKFEDAEPERSPARR